MEPPLIDRVVIFLPMQVQHKVIGVFYEKFWRVHIEPEFGGRRLNAISPTDLDQFTLKLQAKTHLLSHNSKNKEVTKALAPSTIANILKTIRRLYEFATIKGLYTGASPAKRVALPSTIIG